MPQSASSNRKPILHTIASIISSNNLEKIDILDLGIGRGNFGKIIKESIKIPVKIIGIEVWEKYRNKKWDYYDKIIINDISKYLKENRQKYNVVLLIDVLEHFTKEEGRKVLGNILKIVNKAVIVSTPITPYPQRAVKGNPHEIHRALWRGNELIQMGFQQVACKQVFCFAWPPIAKLAIFVYKK